MASKGKTDANLKAHEDTYSGFLKLLTAGVIACVAVAALILFLISR